MHLNGLLSIHTGQTNMLVFGGGTGIFCQGPRALKGPLH